MTQTEALSVTRTVAIAAPISKVWAAITEPDYIEAWSSFTSTIDRADVGATGAWTLPNYGPTPIQVEAADPPFSITYRWGPSGAGVVDPARSTVFTFTLEATDGGTVLTMVETGFEGFEGGLEELESHRQGWDSQLERLAAWAERL